MSEYINTPHTYNNSSLDDDASAYNRVKLNELRNLWRAVVLQALYDTRLRTVTKKMRSARNKALHWIDLNNTEFIEVCQLAGIDPLSVVDVKNSGKAITVKGVKFMF